MTRLSRATLADLPVSIERPAYAPASLRIGIVHLGLRAFQRAHIALPTAEDELSPFDDGDAAGTAGRLAGWGVREAVVKRGSNPCLLLGGQGIEAMLLRAADG